MPDNAFPIPLIADAALSDELAKTETPAAITRIPAADALIDAAAVITPVANPSIDVAACGNDEDSVVTDVING